MPHSCCKERLLRFGCNCRVHGCIQSGAQHGNGKVQSPARATRRTTATQERPAWVSNLSSSAQANPNAPAGATRAERLQRLKAQRQLASSRAVAAQASQQATPGPSQQLPEGRFSEGQRTHDLSTTRLQQEQALLAGASFDEAEHQLLHDALCAVDSAQALHDDVTDEPALDDATEASLHFEASYAGSAEDSTHDVIPASWHSPQRARPSPSRNPLAAQLAALSPERQRQQLAQQPAQQQQQAQVSPAKRRLSASELVKHIREAPLLPRDERPRLILSPARAPAPPQPSGASPGRALDPRQQHTAAALHSPAKPADLHASPSRHAGSPARQDQQPQQDQEEQQMLDATDTLLERCRRLLQGAIPPRSASAASAAPPAAPKGSLSAGASPSRRRVDWQQVLAGNASASSITTSATTSPARSRAAALASSRPGNAPPPASAAAPASRPAGQGLSLEEIKAKYLGMQQAAVERRQAAAAPAGSTMPGVDVGAGQGGPSAWREKLVGGRAVGGMVLLPAAGYRTSAPANWCPGCPWVHAGAWLHQASCAGTL